MPVKKLRQGRSITLDKINKDEPHSRLCHKRNFSALWKLISTDTQFQVNKLFIESAHQTFIAQRIPRLHFWRNPSLPRAHPGFQTSMPISHRSRFRDLFSLDTWRLRENHVKGAILPLSRYKWKGGGDPDWINWLGIHQNCIYWGN